jgi:hypothetical protein
MGCCRREQDIAARRIRGVNHAAGQEALQRARQALAATAEDDDRGRRAHSPLRVRPAMTSEK